MFTKKVSFQQLLDSRDELIELVFRAILRVVSAHHHLGKSDMIVKETYGYWAKVLIIREEQGFVLRMNALGYSWNILTIPESMFGKGDDVEDVEKTAAAAIDAWMSRRIKVRLRSSDLVAQGDDKEMLHQYADHIKSVWEHSVINIFNNGLSYHCMTPEGDLLTSTTISAGTTLTGPKDRRGYAKLEGYTITLTEPENSHPDMADPLCGLSYTITELVITDVANLIMGGYDVMLKTKIEYNDH